MLYFTLKAALSGLLIAAISAIARKNPGFGALVASLPLVSVMGMLWLWRDTHDEALMRAHAASTFWYVLPSLPMFLLIPAMMRAGLGFYPSLALGCAITIALYLGMGWLGTRLGLNL